MKKKLVKKNNTSKYSSKKRNLPKSLKDKCKEFLPKKLQQYAIKSFDVIGNIAIINIPEPILKYEKKIAESLLETNKAIKTVAKKIGNRYGTYRRQPLKVLAGKRTYETIHKEYGARLKLHIRDTYFSPRMCTERKRVADQIKKDELILVMFSGISPYLFIIAKNAQPREVVGIELNPIAHKYAKGNIKLNKTTNVKPILGDVRKVTPKLKKKWNRIVMAWPHGGDTFLDVGIKAAPKGCIIHFYDFGREDEFKDIQNKIKIEAKNQKRKVKILRILKCGQNKPRTYRVVVDFKMLD